MGRRMWRGLRERGAPALTRPVGPGCADGGGLGTAGWDQPGNAAAQAAPRAARQVPGWLERAAGWSWRLLIVGVLIYVLFRLVSALRVVVLPCVAALLLTALLQPLTQRLRRAGGPPRPTARIRRDHLPERGRVTSVTAHQPATARPPSGDPGPSGGSGGSLPRTSTAGLSPAVEAVPVLIKRLDPGLPLPGRAHPGDAGVDLYSAVDVTLAPGQRALVPTGVAVALPDGYAAFVCPRSGLAARHGVTIVNAPGTVDAGYRGEIKVTLLNTDPAQPVRFGRGDRIAQLVVQRVAVPVFHEVQSLPGSARGDGGFGSTGGHTASQ